MSLKIAYYKTKFENDFIRSRGDQFQTFFEKLMIQAYGSDFMPCRPWGNRGDRKNDGFLKSERCLFQVYAPYEMTEKKAIAKIREDFEGAKVYWGTHFSKWVFMHNAIDGLPPHVQKLLLDLEANNPGIQIEPWCDKQLIEIFLKLTPTQMQDWFGPAPSEQAMANLGFSDLQVVLESIAAQSTTQDLPIKEVPPRKLEANALSRDVETLLKAGFSKSLLVERFYNKWHNPKLAEHNADAFRKKYRNLRETLTPNRIFVALQEWAGGSKVSTPGHQVAVLAVLAYYFEHWDIFEEPPDEVSS